MPIAPDAGNPAGSRHGSQRDPNHVPESAMQSGAGGSRRGAWADGALPGVRYQHQGAIEAGAAA